MNGLLGLDDGSLFDKGEGEGIILFIYLFSELLEGEGIILFIYLFSKLGEGDLIGLLVIFSKSGKILKVLNAMLHKSLPLPIH